MKKLLVKNIKVVLDYINDDLWGDLLMHVDRKLEYLRIEWRGKVCDSII